MSKNKLFNLILCISGIFILFLVVSFFPKKYEYNYKIGKNNIIEKYSPDDDSYLFSVETNNEIYEFSVPSKYIRKRGLINSLKQNGECIKVSFSKLDNLEICKNSAGLYTSYYKDEINGNVEKEYDNIDVYDLKNRKYYIWMYEDFLVVDENGAAHIDLFEEDVYQLDVITKINNCLLIADYNQKYHFDKMFLINSKNNKVQDIELDRKLYFNGYFLGNYKKNVYYYDIQKEQEYKINPFVKTLEKNSNELLINGKWEKTTVNKLNKKELYFTNELNYGYYLLDGQLYYRLINNDVLVSDMKISNIIESNEYEAFFISEDSLYYVDYKQGISKIMSYSEWRFNNKNIYIF